MVRVGCVRPLSRRARNEPVLLGRAARLRLLARLQPVQHSGPARGVHGRRGLGGTFARLARRVQVQACALDLPADTLTSVELTCSHETAAAAWSRSTSWI